MSDSLNVVGIRQLYDRLARAYKALKEEQPEVRQLKKKIMILEEVLDNVEATTKFDERRKRSMEMKLELTRERLENIRFIR